MAAAGARIRVPVSSDGVGAEGEADEAVEDLKYAVDGGCGAAAIFSVAAELV